MDLIKNLVQKHFKTAPITKFRSGDTVQVHVKIAEGEKTRIQIYEGIVIRNKGGGLNSAFTVRKISNGVGVERTFPFYSPAIERVEVVARGNTRRSKLYFLRKLEGKAARVDSESEFGGESSLAAANAETNALADAKAKTEKPQAAHQEKPHGEKAKAPKAPKK
jgi:large subunit ribosomal protein L19